MTVRRTLVAAGAALFLLTGVAGTPAAAHGAPDNPVSRAAACGQPGRSTSASAACRAARAGGDPGEQWDNVRVANVAGRDRELVPDGKLCSGGLAAFHGLDLARKDWPATRLTAGASFTFTYRTTIPHRGGFSWYVTRPGYDPTRPLRWSDLEERPFLTATDPPVTGGAYRMRGRVPTGRTGRHVIYAIWRTTSTPDTYYSCSDVLIAPTAATSAGTVAAQPRASGTATPGPTGTATGGVPTPTASNAAARVADVTTHRVGLPLLATGGAALAALALLLGGGRWRSRRTARAGHRRARGGEQ